MSNGLDCTTRYLKFVLLICTLLTIISGIICYMIANKVQTAINPIETRIAAAENSINSHIKVSNKCFESKKEVFDLTVKTINEDINEIKLSQNQVSQKLDNLIQIMLNEKNRLVRLPGQNSP